MVSYAVTCPTWLHKYIIGKKGATIQKLTSELPKVSLLRPSANSSPEYSQLMKIMRVI